MAEDVTVVSDEVKDNPAAESAVGPVPTPDSPPEMTNDFDEGVLDRLTGKGSETDEGKTPEAKAVKATAEEKPTYTPEEIEELLRNDSKIDTGRLSPEGKLLMKSFQRGHDSKFQALAAEKKKLEAEREAELSPKAKLFKRYVENPMRVMGEINDEISQLESIEPGTQEYSKARKAISQLTALKDEYRLAHEQIGTRAKSMETIAAQTIAAVVEAIPDWETKEPKMTEWTINTLGLSMDDINILTDPTKVGKDRALRFIKAVNTAYDKLNAGKTAENKRVIPEKLGSPGSGDKDEAASSNKSLESLSYAEYKKARMKKK